MKTKTKTRRTARRAFTLIELLVAMAITTLIITVLVSITSISLDAWNRSRSEVRASRQAKSMADSMARDFEALVLRRGNNFQWLAADSNPPTDGPNNNRSTNAATLIFFSAATDRYDGKIGTPDDLGGDVSTISYQLEYKDPIGDTSNSDFFTFVLYRKIVNPDDTFKDLLGKTDLRQAFNSYSTSVDDEMNFVCENVYQFTVTFHVEVMIPGTGATATRVHQVPVQIGQGGLANAVDKLDIFGNRIDTPFTGNSSINADQLKAGRITAVEVFLTVLSDFGLQQMRARTFTSDDQKSEFLSRNSYQYSKLIPVPGS